MILTFNIFTARRYVPMSVCRSQARSPPKLVNKLSCFSAQMIPSANPPTPYFNEIRLPPKTRLPVLSFGLLSQALNVADFSASLSRHVDRRKFIKRQVGDDVERRAVSLQQLSLVTTEVHSISARVRSWKTDLETQQYGWYQSKSTKILHKENSIFLWEAGRAPCLPILHP